MFDPVTVSISVVMFIVPKLFDGMMEKFGEEIGMKGVTKISKIAGSMTQSVRDRFHGEKAQLDILTSEASPQSEVDALQTVLEAQLKTDSDLLYELNSLVQEAIQISPVVREEIEAALPESVRVQIQRFGNNGKFEGSVTAGSFTQHDSAGEKNQEQIFLEHASVAGDVVIGDCQQS